MDKIRILPRLSLRFSQSVAQGYHAEGAEPVAQNRFLLCVSRHHNHEFYDPLHHSNIRRRRNSSRTCELFLRGRISPGRVPLSETKGLTRDMYVYIES